MASSMWRVGMAYKVPAACIDFIPRTTNHLCRRHWHGVRADAVSPAWRVWEGCCLRVRCSSGTVLVKYGYIWWFIVSTMLVKRGGKAYVTSAGNLEDIGALTPASRLSNCVSMSVAMNVIECTSLHTAPGTLMKRQRRPGTRSHQLLSFRTRRTR